MKRFLSAALAAAAMVAIPAPVFADSIACTYSASTHEVDLNLSGGVIVYITRDVAGHIKINNSWCGGAATVTNTAHITITGDGGNQSIDIDLANKGFKPGYGNEPGKSDEIEFSVNLGAGVQDVLSILGSGGVDKIDIGQNNALLLFTPRINLNSGESTHVDADMTVNNVELFTILTKGGNDVIRARGLRGTGPDPYNGGLHAFGGPGDDLIKGGEARDELHGDSGKDTVWGFGAADTISLADGEAGDVGYGGPAIDNITSDPGDTVHQD